jgi:thiol-disulfide isomerase/thioredoxin
VRLAQLRDRTTVVNFWATWCVPCRDEMPLLEDVWRAERDQGVTFVGVAIQDDETSLKSFVDRLQITYPTGLDQDDSIALSYEIVGLPTTIFVSPSGRLVRKWQGPIDRERLLNFIAEAQAG